MNKISQQDIARFRKRSDSKKKRNTSYGDLKPGKSKKPLLIRAQSKEDIGSIWQNQLRLKRAEALNKPKKTTSWGSKYKDFITKVLNTTSSSKLPKVTRKRVLALMVVLIIVLLANLQSNYQSDDTAQETTTVRGQSSVSDLPLATDIEDELLFPSGKTATDYEIRINSPPNNADPSYVYFDTIDGKDASQLLVTQQKVESDFNLKAVADSFQATNMINVDGNIIYHGINETTGVQSLMFVKNQILVLVRSSSKLADDVWVAYYIDLKG